MYEDQGAAMEEGRGFGSWRDWLVVALLTGACIFAFVDRFVLSLLLEPIKHDLHLSDTRLGLLNGVAFGIFYAFLGLPLGWLADRWSRKGTIIAGMIAWTVATAACGAAANFLQLLVARIGVGAGEAGLVPASYAIIHDRFAKGRVSLATSVFQIGGFLGMGLSMIAAGFIYKFFIDGGGSALPFIGGLRPWQQTFVAAALPGPLFVFALLFLSDRRSQTGPDLRIADKKAPQRAVPGRLLNVYALLFVGAALEIGCTYAIMSWLPAILSRETTWSPKQVGLGYGLVMLLVAPSGVLVGGAVADRLQRQGRADSHVIVPLFAACAALPLMFLIPFAGTAWLLIGLAGCLHFLLGLPMGVVPTLIQQITAPGRRSRVSAVYVLACNVIGLGLGPVLVGWLSSRSPHDPHALRMAVFYAVVPAVAIALFLFYRLRRIFLAAGVR